MQDLDRRSARELTSPALAALVCALLALYAVGFDQGALTATSSALPDGGRVLHELFHDARHLLGVPCH